MAYFMWLWVAFVFFGCRFLVLSVPIFDRILEQSLAINFWSGIVSDFVTLGILAFVFWLGRSLSSGNKTLRKVLEIGAVVGSLVIIAGVFAHLRYIEHFGMSIRPFHVASLKTGGLQGAGPAILLESPKTVLLMFLPPIFAFGFWRFTKPLEFPSNLTHYALVVIGISILNGTSIRLASSQGIHKELRHNPWVALNSNYNEYKDIVARQKPSKKQLESVRNLFAEGHVWTNDDRLREYPLWQDRLPKPELDESKRSETYVKLRDFLAQSEEPWNIVVVMLETGLSRYIGGLNGKQGPSITPYIDDVLNEGVAFTETIANGSHTKDGQIATLCSFYSVPSFPLMAVAPMTNARCLAEIYRNKDYSTHFYHSADNRFDNKDIFHRQHGSDFVYDENDFPTNTSKGGWGYSDHALFSKVIDDLRTVEKPFFTTVLTLTNHPPLVLPDDSPAHIAELPTKREQVVSYMDWAFGQFYQKIKRDHPQTLVVLLSDQGISEGKGLAAIDLHYKTVRDPFRIPFVFLSPKMPENLRGVRLDHLVANVDVPPTLLSLMGYESEAQQFLGVNAFFRKGPIYTNWFEDLIRIRSTDMGYQIEHMNDNVVATLASLGHYNLYAPPPHLQANIVRKEKQGH